MGTSYRLGMDELSGKSSNSIWKALVAEFIGIFILNFFGCAACTHAAGDKTLISLAFGLSVFMVVMGSRENFQPASIKTGPGIEPNNRMARKAQKRNYQLQSRYIRPTLLKLSPAGITIL